MQNEEEEEVGSHAGTLDISGEATGDSVAASSANHPDSSRRYGGPMVQQYKFPILYSIVVFSLVIVAIALGASSLSKSNEALELAEANAEEAKSFEQAMKKIKDPAPITSIESISTIAVPEMTIPQPEPAIAVVAPPPITPAPTPLPTNQPTTPQPTTGPSITHPLNPKWFQTEHEKYVAIEANEYNQDHHSHLKAGLFCVQNDLDLCPYEVYCPNGQGNPPYMGGPPKSSNWDELKENQWAAYKTPDVSQASSAAGGTWVQVGKMPAVDGGFDGNNHGVCWTWDEWENGGGGDIEDVWNEDHRVWMLCCQRSD